MKTIKATLLAMAFVVGIGGAFATNAHHAAAHQPAAKQTNVWWKFNGTPLQVNDPTKYTQLSGQPTDCSGSTDRCAIEAPANPLHTTQPDLSAIADEAFKN